MVAPESPRSSARVALQHRQQIANGPDHPSADLRGRALGFHNPETLAYGADGLPKQTLYRVRFDQTHVWPDYAGAPQDKVEIEIYEHWLEPTTKGATP